MKIFVTILPSGALSHMQLLGMIDEAQFFVEKR